MHELSLELLSFSPEDGSLIKQGVNNQVATQQTRKCKLKRQRNWFPTSDADCPHAIFQNLAALDRVKPPRKTLGKGQKSIKYQTLQLSPRRKKKTFRVPWESFCQFARFNQITRFPQTISPSSTKFLRSHAEIIFYAKKGSIDLTRGKKNCTDQNAHQGSKGVPVHSKEA